MANDPDNAPLGEDPKIESLEERIAAARRAEEERTAQEHAPIIKMGKQVVSTMVGYPIGGFVVGFALDKLVFHTTPWISIGLMFLAFAGGCYQVAQMNKNSAK